VIKLTLEQQQLYLANGGLLCPHCESRELEAQGNVEVDEAIGTQGVKCLNCGCTWTDIYRLVGIDDDTLLEDE
jgi:DNA-directed RNA polymerase subunit RPC12/RpoP